MSTHVAKPGEDAWEFGGRRFVKLPGELVVATWDKWTLVWCPTRSWNGTAGFRLFLDVKTHKRTWSLPILCVGAKAGEFMPGPEPSRLLQSHPKVAELVLRKMAQFVEANPRSCYWRDDNDPAWDHDLARATRARRVVAEAAKATKSVPGGGAP